MSNGVSVKVFVKQEDLQKFSSGEKVPAFFEQSASEIEVSVPDRYIQYSEDGTCSIKKVLSRKDGHWVFQEGAIFCLETGVRIYIIKEDATKKSAKRYVIVYKIPVYYQCSNSGDGMNRTDFEEFSSPEEAEDRLLGLAIFLGAVQWEDLHKPLWAKK